ncbi:MAG: acyl--CoA ligase, partial [Acidimicrobiia bacterium]|nr:acyl--CoA ligase [Acidimicrobiia bacterium]
MAAGLGTLGVQRGDRVGVFAHSGLDYLLAMFGAWRAGAVAALVDLQRAESLDRYFGHCRPKVLIYTHDYFDAVDRHRAALDSVESYVCFDGAQPGATDWAEILG